MSVHENNIRMIPLLSNFPKDLHSQKDKRLMKHLCDSTFSNSFEAGEVIYRHALEDSFFFVRQGRVDIFSPINGRNTWCCTLPEFSCFNEEAIVGRSLSDLTVTAASKGILYTIRVDAFGALAEEKPMLYLSVARAISDKAERLLSLHRSSCSVRAQRVLIEYLRSRAAMGQNVLALTQRELANRVGIHSNTVGKVLQELSNKKAVEITNANVKITNLRKLS